MAALTANTAVRFRNDGNKMVQTITVKTSQVIYKHALVATGTDGLAYAEANAAARTHAGIAIGDEVEGEGNFPVTGDGTKTVKVASNLECLLPTTLTTGNAGDAVVASTDNDVVAYTCTLGSEVGRFVQADTSGTDAWILLGAKNLNPSA